MIEFIKAHPEIKAVYLRFIWPFVVEVQQDEFETQRFEGNRFDWEYCFKDVLNQESLARLESFLEGYSFWEDEFKSIKNPAGAIDEHGLFMLEIEGTYDGYVGHFTSDVPDMEDCCDLEVTTFIKGEYFE